jgi:hypothetical protein
MWKLITSVARSRLARQALATVLLIVAEDLTNGRQRKR